MSHTKKKFSLPQNLASGLKSAIASATTNQGRLNYDMMPVNIIEPDPNNPRKLSITLEEILNGLSQDINNSLRKKNDLEGIEELAASIKKVGLRNPIEVYKHEDKYRILTGERRFLASNLCGLTTVPVRIVQKPNDYDLRYIQWIENLNRRDLSLWEKYGNLKMISDAYENVYGSKMSEMQLKEMLGVSKSHAYRYHSLLNADAKILDLVKDGKITNLKQVQELVAMKETSSLYEVLANINEKLPDAKKTTNKRKCKDFKVIKLGQITCMDTASYLLDLIINKSGIDFQNTDLKNIDFGSLKAVQKAFDGVLKEMEEKLSITKAHR